MKLRTLNYALVIGATLNLLFAARVLSQTSPSLDANRSKAGGGQQRPSSDSLTETELNDLVAERMGMPVMRVNENFGERLDPQRTVEEGEFDLPPSPKLRAKATVFYRLPLRFKTMLGSEADNIVLVESHPELLEPVDPALAETPQDNGKKPDIHAAPGNPSTTVKDEKAKIEAEHLDTKKRMNGRLTYFSDRLGFTAFAMKITVEHQANPSLTYAELIGSPEIADLVFRAQDEIAKKHKLKPRKLMLLGASLSGCFAEHVAVLRPEKVAAISIHSAPDILQPTAKTDFPWYLGITRGDAMKGDYQKLMQNLRSSGSQFVYALYPPRFGARGVSLNLYHTVNPVAQAAMRAYLRGAVDHRDSTTGAIIPKQWPFVRDTRKPLRVFQAGSAEANAIPENSREYLPSKDFIQCIESGAPPVQQLELSGTTGKPLKCFVSLPPLGKIAGVILYGEEYSYSRISEILDNIDYLSEHNYLVIAPRMTDGTKAPLEKALEFIRRSSALKDAPLAIVGCEKEGDIAWELVTRKVGLRLNAMVPVGFNPAFFVPESHIPPGGGVKCPTLFIYDERVIENVSTSEEAKQTHERLAAVKAYLNKSNELNKISQVQFIPKTTVSDEQTNQKTIEAAESFITNALSKK